MALRELVQHRGCSWVGPVLRVDVSVHVDALGRRPDVDEERRDRQLLGEDVADRGGSGGDFAVGEDDEDRVLGARTEKKR